MQTIVEKITSVYPDILDPVLIEQRTHALTPAVEWQRIRIGGHDPSGGAIGICINTVTFPPQQLHPLCIHFHGPGLARLQQDTELQRSIAHAYWQTVWAQSAIRADTGITEPVAFVALDRPPALPRIKRVRPLRQLTDGHWLVGDSPIHLLAAMHACENGALYWLDGRLQGEIDSGTLAWLEPRTFIDQFIGTNRGASGKITLRRLVPVSGSHLISRLFPAEIPHFSNNQAPLTSAQVFAATNSGFFLNFPEEYSHPWSAMNDPVGLLIQQGTMLQLPLTRRAAVLVDHDNRAHIEVLSVADVAMRLPWQAEWLAGGGEPGFAVDAPSLAGQRVVVYTPAYQAELVPGVQTTPPADAIDFCVVFNEIFEMKIGGCLGIPANGVVISVPRSQLATADPARLLREHGSHVQFRLQRYPHVRTAIAAGPLLHKNGTSIRADYFEGDEAPEQFMPMQQLDGTTTCAGIAPTRFPHDVAETRAPRTFAGVTTTGELMLGVIDGRKASHSAGATLAEIADLAVALGCTEVLNLDGGGSSVLFVNPHHLLTSPLAADSPAGIVNVPSDRGHQDRLIPVAMLVLDSP